MKILVGIYYGNMSYLQLVRFSNWTYALTIVDDTMSRVILRLGTLGDCYREGNTLVGEYIIAMLI